MESRRPRLIDRRAVLATLVVLFLTAPRHVAAWGPAAHRAVTAKAIDTLPGGIKTFYKTHRLELPTLALDADIPDEGIDRRFAVDHLVPFPFTELPRSEAALKERFGDAANQVGRLPWLIHESYARLVEAFKSKDKAKILEESDLLAGLVTDLDNPLAVTDNADGQKSGQHGLWMRFAVRFPEAAERSLKISPDAARFLDEPKEYVFSMMKGAYVWVDNILYLEEIAHRGKGGYTEAYYEALATRVGEVLRWRFAAAAEDVGSYWYTAWTVAGRPEIK
jgi:hypothetical protein